MELSQEQIKTISSYIPLSEIISYINSHKEEYKKFVENEKNKTDKLIFAIK